MHTVEVLVALGLAHLEATPAVLAERCRVTRAGMTSRLDRLELAGYVSRTIDPGDRRRVLIQLGRLSALHAG